MQNLHFLESGRFILTKKELKEAVSLEDCQVLELGELPDGFEFEHAFSVLFAWCQKAFSRTEELGQHLYRIRLLRLDETEVALRLAWEIFFEYESPEYASEGTEEFRRCLHDNNYLAGIRYYGAIAEDKLVGIREEKFHICFFFVDGKYQHRGIGRALFKRTREDFPGQRITVHSSPYGVPFYKALGFIETDCEQTICGIRFTPMEYNKREGTCE